jgi:predicted enzyme related to lactoylglutathione lyase
MSGRKIVHIEIPAENRDEAGRFFSELFGWKINHLNSMNYSTFDAGGIGGALTEMDGKIFQGNDTLIYVQSDDIDADLKRAIELGGKKLIGKTDIPGIAQYAVVIDPAGNRLGFWKSAR